MKRPLLVALLIAAGCESEQSERSDEVPVHPLIGLPAHSPATLDAAAELLGLAFIPPEKPGGGVVLVRVEDSHEGRGGRSDWIHPCVQMVWARDDAHVLAHELGHALGLEHVDDRQNLMFGWTGGGDELTDQQIDTMRYGAWWLQSEC